MLAVVRMLMLGNSLCARCSFSDGCGRLMSHDETSEWEEALFEATTTLHIRLDRLSARAQELWALLCALERRVRRLEGKAEDTDHSQALPSFDLEALD